MRHRATQALEGGWATGWRETELRAVQAATEELPLLKGAARLAKAECCKLLRRTSVVVDKRERKRVSQPNARMLAKVAHANALTVFTELLDQARCDTCLISLFRSRSRCRARACMHIRTSPSVI